MECSPRSSAVFPPTLSSRDCASDFQTKPQLPGCPGEQHLKISRHCSSDDKGAGNGFPATRGKIFTEEVGHFDNFLLYSGQPFSFSKLNV